MLHDSPSDAADLAEFFIGIPGINRNGGIDWAERRKKYGLEQPAPITLWELGNEINTHPAPGWSVKRYVEAARKIISRVREIDPNARFAALVAHAPQDRKHHPDIDSWRSWHKTVLQELGMDIDYLAFHPYYYGGASMAQIFQYIALIREDIREITHSDHIALYFSEHARSPPRLPLTSEEVKAGRKKGKLDQNITRQSNK